MPRIGDSTGAPAAGVPAGGSAGQVLVKRSAADFDTGWGASGGGATGPLPKFWYDGRFNAVQAGTVLTLSTGVAYWTPIFMPQATTITGLAVCASPSTSATVSLAMAGATAAGLPAALLAPAQTVTGTGTISVTGLSIAVSQGWNFLVVSVISATTSTNFIQHDDGNLRLPYTTYGAWSPPTVPTYYPGLTSPSIVSNPTVTPVTTNPLWLACST